MPSDHPCPSCECLVSIIFSIPADFAISSSFLENSSFIELLQQSEIVKDFYSPPWWLPSCVLYPLPVPSPLGCGLLTFQLPLVGSKEHDSLKLRQKDCRNWPRTSVPHLITELEAPIPVCTWAGVHPSWRAPQPVCTWAGVHLSWRGPQPVCSWAGMHLSWCAPEMVCMIKIVNIWHEAQQAIDSDVI